MSRGVQLLGVPAVRGRFPALALGAAYLDGPGGWQAPQYVIDAVATYMRDSNAPRRRLHDLGGPLTT